MADFEQQVQQLMAITGCEDQAFCAELLLTHSFDVVSAHAVNNLRGEENENLFVLPSPLPPHLSVHGSPAFFADEATERAWFGSHYRAASLLTAEREEEENSITPT